MNSEQQKIYDKFVQFAMNDEKYKLGQNTMAIEESLEFSLAILHMIRGKATRSDLVSEIADLENMIGQIKAMNNVTDEEVAEERIRKVERAAKKAGLDLDLFNCEDIYSEDFHQWMITVDDDETDIKELYKEYLAEKSLNEISITINNKGKKISTANKYYKSKAGCYNFVLLDGTNMYEYTKWSNKKETLEKEKAFIIKINPDLGNRLIIVDTQIQDFYK